MEEHQTARSSTGGSISPNSINMKSVIGLAVLAAAFTAVSGAPRPSVLAGPTLIKSAEFLDGAIISAPAAVAIAPAAISSQSTLIAHHAPVLTYAHAAPLAYAHHAPFAYAHSFPIVAAAPGLIPAGKTTVIAGPSGTITETQGLGALAYKAW